MGGKRILFEKDIPYQRGSEEAISIDAAPSLEKIEIAFFVKDDSALPLALPGQIVLGGKALTPADFEKEIGALVALRLDDGSAKLKRIGQSLPGDLSHIRQFDSIGGHGESFLFATEPVDSRNKSFPLVVAARQILGVLYA